MRIPALLLFTLALLQAQIPEGYYDAAAGLSGNDLHAALHDIIDNHTQQSYSSLHDHYELTDARPDGTVWDMYSDIPDGTPPYTFNFTSGDQCGNYSGEGDCYNREHSWPKSWFNDQYPMYSDLFHVVPSDGYVNGQRGNFPYGEVSNPNWTSLNGSKRGPNTYPGYSGTVFEPIDAYKGDFARIYFYMSTRYLGEDDNWSGSPMANGAQLEEWALNMMLEWHENDPVSEKETDRNNAVHDIQNNRNPFVDHPEYAAMIWQGASPGLMAPSDLYVTDVTETSFVLHWADNNSNEIGHNLYLDGEFLATVTDQVLQFTFGDLAPATSYQVDVTAFDMEGLESMPGSINVTTSGGGGVVHFLEDFETTDGNSYVNGSIDLPSGTWDMSAAGNFELGVPYEGERCIAINDDTNDAYMTTPAVSTCGSVSFYYYQRFGGGTDEFLVQKQTEGGDWETIAVQNYAVGETYTQFVLNVNDPSPVVRIRVVNDDQSGHLIIDNFELTSFDPSAVKNNFLIQPEELNLHAFPNPFNAETTFSFQLTSAMTRPVHAYVVNIQGERVAEFSLERLHPGRQQTLHWNAETSPSGVYIFMVQGLDFSAFRRITLLK